MKNLNRITFDPAVMGQLEYDFESAVLVVLEESKNRVRILPI
jgi:hypothetical protein